MQIWKAIIEAIAPYPPGHEFALEGEGFLYPGKEGKLVKAGLTDMVKLITGTLVYEGSVSRRLRELRHGDYDKLSGMQLDYEVVKGEKKRGWYRLKKLEPICPPGNMNYLGHTPESDEKLPGTLTFRPVEGKGGELHLF
jgi:hypothetical protein